MSHYYHATQKGGPHDFGIACYTAIVLVVTVRLIIEKAYWTWLSHVAVWGTLFIYGVFGLVYSSTVWEFMGAHGADLYWIVQVCLRFLKSFINLQISISINGHRQLNGCCCH